MTTKKQNAMTKDLKKVFSYHSVDDAHNYTIVSICDKKGNVVETFSIGCDGGSMHTSIANYIIDTYRKIFFKVLKEDVKFFFTYLYNKFISLFKRYK